MRKVVLTIAVALAALTGWHSTANDKSDPKEVLADRFFEYTGSKWFSEDNLGTIAQAVDLLVQQHEDER